MKQAVLKIPKVIEIGEGQEPVSGKDEILLKIHKIGICGSDIHIYHGTHPVVPLSSYPLVQGHEYSAVVEKIGSDVRGVNVGLKVTGRPQVVCGECSQCKSGDYNICSNMEFEGCTTNGCAQDYFAIDKNRVYPFPDTISFEKGALIEPMAVGVSASEKAKSLKGKNVVVFGAGTIGNFIAQSVRKRGAKNILIRDISEYRLDIAIC